MSRQELLRKLSAAQFAMWELHLYLDTHPTDSQAMSLFRKYEKRATELKKEYENRFGPLTFRAGEKAAQWLEEPWPWETQGGIE